MQRTSGSRFATLVGRLGVSGESLRRTLQALQAGGLVERNPGYGHPLRPEYVLTERGRQVAPRVRTLVEAVGAREDVALKKWSLPVLAALDRPRRFSELRATVKTTPRALALALKDLQAAGLVRRSVVDDYPPAVVYEAAPEARPIVRAARRL